MGKVIELAGYAQSKFVRKLQGRAVRASTIHATSKVEAGSLVVDSSMDRHSFCGYGCSILRTDIGAFCSIANGVSIGVGGRHPSGFVSTSPVFMSHKDSVKTKFARHDVGHGPRTSIGNDVWIGEGALIKAGVTIGDGAIIGMGSVVTRDVAPYAIAAGTPAREIRIRFDPSVVERLLSLRWWAWSDAALTAAGPYFDDPGRLFDHLERR